MSYALVESGPDQGAIWHFGDPVKEQRALLAGTGWADLSHREIITISGKDRLSWLHSLTTQFLENLAPGVWSSALILDPQGHIEYQFTLVDDGDKTFLVMDPGFAEPLLNYLLKMKFMLDVHPEITNDYSILRAPGAATEIGGPFALVPTSEKEEMKRTFQLTAQQVGVWALEAERIAAGRARVGVDTDHKSIPNELGFLNGSVHMNKGCYRGQETVAKIANLGNPPRRLVMLHLDGSVVDVPAPGTDVENAGVRVGFMGSVARHYELGNIALAVVKRNTPVEAELKVANIPAAQEVIVPA